MKLLTRIHLSIGFILFIFLIVTVSYLFRSKELEGKIGYVVNSMDFRSKAEDLQRSRMDMETGLRGFLIAEKESFLEPYIMGLKNSRRISAEMHRMVKDSTENRLLLENDRLQKRWMAFAETMIRGKKAALQNPNKEPEFEKLKKDLLKSGHGKAIMDQIRVRFAALEAHEDALKNDQVKVMYDTLMYTRYVYIGLTLLAIFLGVITAYLLGRTIHRRLSAMINLAGRISQGNFSQEIKDPGKDELSLLTESLNLMAEKLNLYFTNLTRTNKELDQFAYVVSHDLKAPLRAINNLSEWLEEDITDTDPDIRKNLKLMRGRAHRMENLINGILEYSKVGRTEVIPSTFNVKKLLEDIVDSLAPPANTEITLPENAPDLTTEKIFMQQVFTNLISNSLKYNNKPQGKISIRVKDADPFYEFKVTDNGPGIPEAYHQKVFGFFQTIEARDTRESTGVGLAIVKKIIDEKGGTIHIESVEDEFTSFVFTWPKVSRTTL
jgi:signal transduction histidine kinase